MKVVFEVRLIDDEGRRVTVAYYSSLGPAHEHKDWLAKHRRIELKKIGIRTIEVASYEVLTAFDPLSRMIGTHNDNRDRRTKP